MAILKPKEIAERSGVLQRWDNNGALKAYCTPMLKVLFLMKQLLKEVMDNQVDTIFITYKDRFALVMTGLKDYVRCTIRKL